LLWKDRTDPECARLVELFHSQEARRCLTVTAQQLTIVMMVPLAIAAFLLRNNLNWSLTSFLLESLQAVIGTRLVIFPNLVAWGLRAWASEVAPEELEPKRPHGNLR
jgi:membrane protein YdbS with pleckstrin-like domain